MHLTGASTGGESRDEFVELGDFLFALRILRFDLRADLRLGDDHVVIRAGVGDDGLVVNVGNVSADVIQKVAIMRDDDQYAIVLIQKFFQPVDRVQIQVVGGFV